MEIKLKDIKGVGEKLTQTFRKENIWSTYDLVLRYPKLYENYSISSLYDVKDKEKITVTGVIVSQISFEPYKKNMVRFDAKIFNQKLNIIVFGRKYLAQQLNMADEVVIKGVYNLYQKTIVASHVIKKEKHQEFKPSYQIPNVYDQTVSNLLKTIFANKQVSVYETIPEKFIKRYHLPSRLRAFEMLHFPKTEADIQQARRRFKYEEAFFLQLRLMSKNKDEIKRPEKALHEIEVADKIKQLPFSLTNDQLKALDDIYQDFSKPHVSYRLIQGDVGSGKTIVAFLAMYVVVLNNEQAVLMAPTEILAQQHYQNFVRLFPELRTVLLTRKTANKDKIKTAIANHEYDVIIGTHALIENDVEFAKLSLTVIDEQHKFGVQTREELINKAHYKDILYLTATPIPRSLALIAYGKSRVSSIKEKPASRKKTKTVYIDIKQQDKLDQAIQKTLKQNQHVYVVVPAIDSTKIAENIITIYEQLKQKFKAPIFVLHGKLAESEKENVMQDFIETKGSILLATTVIEVGVDVKSATLMVIYGAEYFGLAQLHQLRGRVGRGSDQSTCYLVSQKSDVERLNLLEQIDNGFKLSQYDLQTRGPGDFIGTLQSGYLNFAFLNLIEDEKILLEAHKNVQELFNLESFEKDTRYKHLHKFIRDDLKI